MSMARDSTRLLAGEIFRRRFGVLFARLHTHLRQLVTVSYTYLAMCVYYSSCRVVSYMLHSMGPASRSAATCITGAPVTNEEVLSVSFHRSEHCTPTFSCGRKHSLNQVFQLLTQIDDTVSLLLVWRQTWPLLAL